jgi:hypothetical protein
MDAYQPTTLYVAVNNRTGLRSLPFDSMTGALLWVMAQGYETSEWTVELVRA